MRWSVVATVYRREVRDVLRDRRTLFTMLVLPLILYPVLMLGFTQLTLQRTKELRSRETPVMVRVGGVPVTRGTTAEAGSLLARIMDVESFVFRAEPDPGDAIDRGALRLAVDLPADLEARLDAGEPVELAPLHRSADDASRTALESFRRAVRDFRKSRVPLDVVETGDRASAAERGGHAFGGLLAMLVVTMALTGAFYPALDVAAGEKERGTLETLLLSPASRQELVLGKFLTVVTVAVAAAAANLLSMALTFRAFSSMLPGSAGGGLHVGFTPGSIAVIFLGLVLIAALFSAVTLALSTFARSYKEGQSYLTPVFVVVMPLGMIGMLPDTNLDLGLALLPVANVALMMKALLTGNFPWVPILVALGSLAVLTTAVLHWTAGLFSREEVLFREGKQVFGLRPPPGVERPTRPSAGVALLAFFLGFAWLYHASLRLAPHGIAMVLVGINAGLLAVAILLPTISMVRWIPGLGLRRPSGSAVGLGLLCGVLGIPASLAVGALQVALLGDPAETAAGMQDMFRDLSDAWPLPVVVVLLSLVPALGEEFLFRGLMLQGFRSALRDGRAVVASAVAFGLFHADLHRLLPQATLGIVLGWLTLRTGSLWPAILAHAAHNAGVALIHFRGGPGFEAWVDARPWVVPLSGGVALAILFVLLRRSRQASPPQSPAP